MTGFIMVPRGTASHSLFKTNPQYLAAYIWLLEVASTTSRQVNYAGQTWQLKKDQIVITVRKLSTALSGYGFTERSTRVFLKNLNKNNLVTVQVTKFGTVLTLKSDTASDTPNDTASDTPKRKTSQIKRTKRDTPNDTASDTPNDTQINNGSINTSPLNPPKGSNEGELKLFKQFWNNYPPHRRTKRAEARAMFMALTIAEQQAALISLEKVKTSVQWTKDKGQYVPSPCKWLGNNDFETMAEKAEAAEARAADKAAATAAKQKQDALEREYDKFLQGMQDKAAQGIDLDELEKCVTSRTARTMLRSSQGTTPLVRAQVFELAGITPPTIEQWSKNHAK